MFDLAAHLIEEGKKIARELKTSGEHSAPIRETGLFVIDESVTDFTKIHEIDIDDQSFYIAQKQ
jgi:hypothetical protein